MGDTWLPSDCWKNSLQRVNCLALIGTSSKIAERFSAGSQSIPNILIIVRSNVTNFLGTRAYNNHQALEKMYLGLLYW